MENFIFCAVPELVIISFHSRLTDLVLFCLVFSFIPYKLLFMLLPDSLLLAVIHYNLMYNSSVLIKTKSQLMLEN